MVSDFNVNIKWLLKNNIMPAFFLWTKMEIHIHVDICGVFLYSFYKSIYYLQRILVY